MSKHEILNSAEHTALRIRAERSEELGDAVMCCITFPGEFRSVQNCYPILFQLSPERDKYNALALFGFENGENLFLDNKGWNAHYLPLAIDIQPFLIGLSGDGDGAAQVHIDMASPRISEQDGVRLFDDSGHSSPYLDTISEKLGALDMGYKRAADFFTALLEYDLLEPFSLDVELANASKHRLVGFHIINEDRLRALTAPELGTLHRAGHLFPIFMALASLSNIAVLVDLKNRQLEGV
jgi:SapC